MCKSGTSKIVYGARVDSDFGGCEPISRQWTAQAVADKKKIEARLSYVDDKTLLCLAEVLKVPVQELFPPRTPGNRIHDFIEKLQTTRF
jgi:hypothetical protein